MKITNPKRKRKTIVFYGLAIAIIIAFAVAGWISTTSTTPQKPTNTASKDSKTSPLTTKPKDKETVGNQQKEPVKNQDVDVSQSPSDVPVNNNLTLNIESLSHQNGVVSYRAKVSGATNGSCSVTFTSNLGKPVLKNYTTNDGICYGDINETEFDAMGKWNMSIKFYTNNTQISGSQEVEIK